LGENLLLPPLKIQGFLSSSNSCMHSMYLLRYDKLALNVPYGIISVHKYNNENDVTTFLFFI